MIIALASSAIFTRLLRPDEFGRYMLVLTSASLIVALASRWLEQGVARYLPKVAWSEARTSILEPTALGITLATLLAGVVAMSVSLVAVLLGLSVWLPFLLPASIFVLATAVQQPLLAVLLGEQQAGSYSLFRVGPSAVQFVTSLILVSLVDAGAPGLMWGSALGAAALLPFLIRATGIAQHVPTWRQWAQQLPHLRTFARYGIPMTGWFVAAVLLFAGDRWIIELTRDSSEVGIYSANSNLMQGAAIFIAMPLILTMHPRLMRAWDREGPAVAASLLGRSVSYGIPAATIAIGLTALTFPEIAIVLLGAEFREGAFIMPIVLAGLVFWELANYLQKPLEFFLKTRLMVAAAL